MRKIISIDGKEIMMEVNGATPRIYRSMFGSDLLPTLQSAVSSKGEVVSTEVFENLAFCMAKQSGETEAETIEEWLAQFESPLAIANSIKDIFALWKANTATTVTAKKKARQ